MRLRLGPSTDVPVLSGGDIAARNAVVVEFLKPSISNQVAVGTLQSAVNYCASAVVPSLVPGLVTHPAWCNLANPSSWCAALPKHYL